MRLGQDSMQPAPIDSAGHSQYFVEYEMAARQSFPRVWAAAILLAAPAGLLAQWPPYPTAGVPKTADGKPDLNGPAPRMPDGKPDLSGVWLYQRPPGTPA